ncbi:hypothetical protein [Acidiphilium acidophilum]|uniref:Glycosyltransferase RgtA/B/C/D-like domain-containing protein n=1 Tax=Acidiphilium acidophilum TaxID=76588 RepID=A0AAW9DTB5_ACIAO|nr:hypothetical protein [Acidiphilium acidophilum]MDX5931892.1 hypothetical protein [Acidiphilium acidophilum]
MAAISGLDARAGGDAAAGFGEAGLIAAGAALMLWPALHNGFPLIFSDTGTYISQAMEFHLGWDRPPFYSFFILALDWGRSLWPPVLAQCLATSWLIRRTQLMVVPGAGLGAGAVLLGGLSLVTSLPWTAAQIMPDIFTPMMVLAFALLVLEADLSNVEIRVLAGIVTLALMVHLSNLPIYAGLCLTVLAARVLRRGWVRWRALLLPVVIGTAALIGVNLIASGRPSPSPYGATFILARLLGDGPARVVLARDCAARDWALCAYRHEIPHTADAFLWRAGSPLYRAGGPVRLIGQTKAIVTATLVAEPGWVARDAGRDFLRQMMTFAPGSGLRPWYATAWQTIARDMARPDVRAFIGSLQAHGRLRVPDLLMSVVQGLAVIGMALTGAVALAFPVAGFCGAGWWPATFGRGGRLVALAWIVGLALIGNAAVTGALSGPHDRYQSRIVWLAVMVGMLIAQRVQAGLRSRPIRRTA